MAGVLGMRSGARGEKHWQARLSDQEVEWARQLHETHKIPPRQIAEKLEAPLDTIKNIIYYRTRRC